MLRRPISIWLMALAVFSVKLGAQEIAAPNPQTATVSGTVLDVNEGIVPNASVHLQGGAEQRTTQTSDTGFFTFDAVQPGASYRLSVSAPDFATWTSDSFVLNPGQFYMAPDIKLRLAVVESSVTALTPEEAATQEVREEESQRVFGVIPNFYVVYDHDTPPLTAKLKIHLAMRALIDPVTLAGFALNSAFYQAARYPSYQEGWTGYGQRLGSTFAGGYTNVLVGDAFLPALFHQDPRYFYQGTGTTSSRLKHALSNAFITRGDNGREQINFSGILGDLSSGAVANAYYPDKDRGAGLVVSSTLIGLAGRTVNGVVQEFVLHRVTNRRASSVSSSNGH